MTDTADAEPGAADRIARLERRVERERTAREEAERIAEQGMRDLWHINSDLEERVGERTAELERSLGAATMAAEAKERFLAELGHELTTPLHAVMGLLELIDASALQQEDQARLDAVRQNSSELSTLLNGLIELAGAEGETAPDDIVDLRPAEWLDGLVATWTRPAASRGQLLVPSTDAPDDTIPLDWRRLRRISDAVLANVTDHAAPGSVEISLTCEMDRVLVVVTDSGPGMAPEELSSAFEPFVRYGNAGHVGVGLSVAQRRANVGGGALTLSSDGSSSTIVSFSLPRL